MEGTEVKSEEAVVTDPQVAEVAIPGDEEAVDATAEDLFGEGAASLRRIVIPELQKGGKPLAVYQRFLSADEVMRFEDVKGDTPEAKEKSKRLQRELIADSTCDRNGRKLLTPEQVGRMAAPAYLKLLKSATGGFGVEVDKEGNVKVAEGNASSEAQPDASPTA